MDKFYSKIKAGEQTSTSIRHWEANHPLVRYLNNIFKECNTNPNSPQMYGMTPKAVDRFKLSIVKEDSDTASKLVKQDEETQELEEATVAIQGILCKAILLLFNLKIRYTPKAKLVPVLEFIGNVEITNDSRSSLTHSTIVASNRFFTPAKQADGLDTIAISLEVDSCGILTKVDGSRWIHTKDNEVAYYILSEDGSCVPTSPIVFHIRDIVEAQVSMLCVPHKGKYTIKLLLRSLLLLSGHFTTEATTARTLMIKDIAAKPPPRKLKRRNVYATNLCTRKTASMSKGCIDAVNDFNGLLEPTEEQVNEDLMDDMFENLAEPAIDNDTHEGVQDTLIDA
ncbi:hypothetical protein BDN71DRAFT_1432926 [Pleurotus eryngii]|uniref:Uncharacterized protein n=1 Tax=Pleurotus eryngii TaxID=5323 RepID=A0A9P5ZTI1_PLEER|nr:hypothetical protein BDN71DRAFT_1432926 [Pleurotus eryngii]